jgi:hypothetical protein
MRDRVEKGRGDTLVACERRGALPRTQAARGYLRASPGRREKLRFAAIGRTAADLIFASQAGPLIRASIRSCCCSIRRSLL